MDQASGGFRIGADLHNPQSLNKYTYVLNNPLRYTDPTGHCPGDDDTCSANLSVHQVTSIVFNETQSLHGDATLDTMRKDVANAVINGDNAQGSKRPITAPDSVTDKQAKTSTFTDTEKSVKCARDEAKKGVDPTDAVTHFNLRPNDSTKDFEGAKNVTRDGPFTNSAPSSALPKGKDVYVNTYKVPPPPKRKEKDQ